MEYNGIRYITGKGPLRKLKKYDTIIQRKDPQFVQSTLTFRGQPYTPHNDTICVAVNESLRQQGLCELNYRCHVEMPDGNYLLDFYQQQIPHDTFRNLPENRLVHTVTNYQLDRDDEQSYVTITFDIQLTPQFLTKIRSL